jgi:glycosyltransferase involved in cell wall biosynthesis
MRIAYFVWEYSPRLVGGLGTYADEITKQFSNMGHDVSVFTMNDGSKLPTHEIMNAVEVFRPLAADVTDVLPLFSNEELKRWGPGLGFFSDILMHNLVCANKFANSVSKAKKFDLIVCHDWLSSMAGLISKKSTGLPLVLHMHSTEFGRRGEIASGTVSEIERFTGNRADLVITVSHAMKKELVSLGFPEDRVEVVWNGVDERKYDISRLSPEGIAAFRERNGIAKDDKVIMFTGRLTPVKGVDTLIEAMPLIKKEIPNTKLVLLGKGELEDHVKSSLKRLGIESKVILINRWVDEDERIMLYASSDVVCTPSRYEPFGIVPLEAMALSKPVVVGLGGLRETVQDAVNGLYCDPENPKSIAKAILKILLHKELAQRFGAAGRERVLGTYRWASIAERTMGLYKKLTETAQKPQN